MSKILTYMIRSEQITEIFRGMISLKRVMMLKSTDSAPPITPSQWHAVSAIGDGASTVKAVAAELRVSSSAATQLVDGLVKAGYVLRSPGTADKRETVLSLSKDSEVRIKTIRKQKMAQFEQILSALSEKELGTFAGLMKKLSDNLDTK